MHGGTKTTNISKGLLMFAVKRHEKRKESEGIMNGNSVFISRIQGFQHPQYVHKFQDRSLHTERELVQAVFQAASSPWD